jgi:predicted anti-sigma-YlaC factor YlaD
MTCKDAQENLYEYLDGALSPSDTASLRRHLDDCATCRQMLQRETDFARLTSSGLERAVEEVRLEPHARRRIAQVAEKNLVRTAPQYVPSYWMRLARRFAATAALLILIIGALYRFGSQPHSPPESTHVSVPLTVPDILVNLSYSAPRYTYTFRQDGDTVVDCLVYESPVIEASLISEN